MKYFENYSLKNLNTFGIEASTKYFTEIFSEKELIELLSDEKSKHEKKMVLGGGSNILFTKNFNGLLIKNSISSINVLEENDDSVLIEAGAGVIWNDLVKFCVERNFGGIENLTLIPGTVGAAPIQNIGAYGQELADTFYSLDGFYFENCEKKTFSKSECGFSYRSSIFKEKLKDKFIVTSIKLKLNKIFKLNDSYKTLNEYIEKAGIKDPTIRNISDAVAEIRRSKLPDPSKLGNAGSFFKNPEVNFETLEKLKSEYPDIKSFPSESGKVKISAGWLIEKCGLKGKQIGDVGTSPDHALVICNFGNATGNEILEFAMRIKQEVANKFGITLQEEVNIL
jgi:UDP-N-acetylmuramate dehydrogenase